MFLTSRVENVLMGLCNWIYALIPQPQPDRKKIESCRIVSHRGIHDNLQIHENTFPAFDLVLGNNSIWGIELDFRWTKDLVPVVIHDPDMKRVFGNPEKICDLDFSELRKCIPVVPSLEEVIQKYGGKKHLMVEAKAEGYPDPVAQNRILSECLIGLQPCRDYHLLSLEPKMLELIDCIESSAKVLVAEINQHKMSSLVLEHQYAGLGGHYLLITPKIISRHKASGQFLGTGYPESKNCFFREINRGVDWLFSNHADQLAQIRDKVLIGMK